MARPWAVGIAVAACALAADQIAKFAAIAWLAGEARPVEVLAFLDLRLGYNKGISFGMLKEFLGERPWLVISASAAIVAALIFLILRADRRGDAASLGAVVGGALGNLTDRLRQGAVTDFIDLHAYGWHWPSFNLADTAIVVGAAGLVGISLKPRNAAADPAPHGGTPVGPAADLLSRGKKREVDR
ncbi:MAG: signal peptidase II [Alphaproteobacteria bacterium]|nr:signal peptidase II [Alphaproteobacteria bacterium]